MSAQKTYWIQKFKFDCVRESSYNVPRSVMANRSDATAFVRWYLKDKALEQVCIIALDSGNRIIGFQSTEGSPNQCAVYPQNVFRFLLGCGAAGCVLAHNHPGGNTGPSKADWMITERVFRIGKDLDIPLLDHLLITDDQSVSLRELGQWPG